MKKIFTVTIALAISSFSVVNAQDAYNKWSLGLNIGGHYGTNPTSMHTKTLKLTHYGLNARYMMNNRVGIMLDGGYDMYTFNKGNVEMKSQYIRTSFQGVINLGDILKFDTWTKHIGLMAHAGAGISVLSNHKDTREKYNIAKRKDMMVNAIIGLTPQVKLGERVSLNLDVSFITNVKQDYNFEMSGGNHPAAFKNYLLNWSVGASFYLGKNATHADWTPTVYGGKTVETTNYEQRIKELENKIEEDIQKEESK